VAHPPFKKAGKSLFFFYFTHLNQRAEKIDMCDTCGCGADSVSITKPGESTHMHADGTVHRHHHSEAEHHHHSHHGHGNNHSRTIAVQTDVMTKNNLLAERNRGFFQARGIFALNLVSSPGSGKTTLLEKTILALRDKQKINVIEGDQQTLNDANRIAATGATVVQVNTGNGCHLDADMVNRSFASLELSENSLLFIENVGNLVCPALFDLGEAQKVVVLSTTEGEDKPLKYPTMFSAASICIINKADLLPHLDFDVEQFRAYATQINPGLQFFTVSAKSGAGLEAWYRWLLESAEKNRQA
jgi:hydrogenase nickel incorporation protein HypB